MSFVSVDFYFAVRIERMRGAFVPTQVIRMPGALCGDNTLLEIADSARSHNCAA
ncbi:hypothetical protein [Burkholderia anthina]|uniref:hypothetical protein n=1 Tax=Burkholderia anthina TaxID=179879 RepID=UPI00158A5E3E|nr:hypothetical protein [Burkholderia anthina]